MGRVLYSIVVVLACALGLLGAAEGASRAHLGEVSTSGLFLQLGEAIKGKEVPVNDIQALLRELKTRIMDEHSESFDQYKRDKEAHDANLGALAGRIRRDEQAIEVNNMTVQAAQMTINVTTTLLKSTSKQLSKDKAEKLEVESKLKFGRSNRVAEHDTFEAENRETINIIATLDTVLRALKAGNKTGSATQLSFVKALNEHHVASPPPALLQLASKIEASASASASAAVKGEIIEVVKALVGEYRGYLNDINTAEVHSELRWQTVQKNLKLRREHLMESIHNAELRLEEGQTTLADANTKLDIALSEESTLKAELASLVEEQKTAISAFMLLSKEFYAGNSDRDSQQKTIGTVQGLLDKHAQIIATRNQAQQDALNPAYAKPQSPEAAQQKAEKDAATKEAKQESEAAKQS